MLASELATALAIRVLPQPGGPYSRIPFGRRQLVLDEQLPVQERQLDGVGDGLDLVVEAADVRVGDVGHLLEDQLLDLGPGQLLQQQTGPRVHQHRVAGPELHARQAVGQLDHPLLVGPADDDGPGVVEQLLEGHHLAGLLGGAGQDHVERLVEHHLGAPAQLRSSLECQLGVQGDPHLAAAGEHVDGAVVVAGQEGAVGGRRLGELVDLLPQGGDVLAGLAEGEGQALVLGNGLLELALGLEQLLLEGPDPLGRVLHAAAQAEHFLLQHLRLIPEVRHLALVGGGPGVRFGVAHSGTFFPGLRRELTPIREAQARDDMVRFSRSPVAIIDSWKRHDRYGRPLALVSGDS